MRRIWPPTTEALGIAESEIQQAAFSPALLSGVIRGSLQDDSWREETFVRLSEEYGESSHAMR